MPAGFALSIDRADRQEAEDAGARWAAIAESSDVAIVGRRLDGTITSWNRGAELLYGYTADEAIGWSVAMLVPLEIQHELTRLNEHLDQGERIDRLEARRVGKDGPIVDVLLNLASIRGPGGDVVGVSAVALDITARKAAEAALIASEARAHSTMPRT